MTSRREFLAIAAVAALPLEGATEKVVKFNESEADMKKAATEGVVGEATKQGEDQAAQAGQGAAQGTVNNLPGGAAAGRAIGGLFNRGKNKVDELRADTGNGFDALLARKYVAPKLKEGNVIVFIGAEAQAVNLQKIMPSNATLVIVDPAINKAMPGAIKHILEANADKGSPLVMGYAGTDAKKAVFVMNAFQVTAETLADMKPAAPAPSPQ